MSKSSLWRGLTTTAASLLAISVVVSGIANDRASFLNARLGTSNYQVVDNGTEEVDSAYYKSDFTTLEEVVNAKKDLAERISEEGSVLLKNNGVLPLDKGAEKVTLWGFNSSGSILGGMMGSSAIAGPEQVTYGMEEAMAEKGFQLNEDMMAFYADPSMDQYRMQSMLFGQVSYGHALTVAFGAAYEGAPTYFTGEAPANLYSEDLLASADGSAAVVVISRDSSEAADYQPTMVADQNSGDSFERPLALSQNERDVINLAKAHSTKVIVVLNADNPMEIEELKNDDEIGAVLWVGAPGVNGFLGVADILSGDANPSGHLTDTYAINSTSAMAMANYGLFLYENASVNGGPLETGDASDLADWYIVETEGIYTGYKYYETRYEDQILGQGNAAAAEGSSTGSAWNYADEISYPFGYGMSYTTFEQTLDSVEAEVGGEGTAAVTVTNTGDVAGKSAVELYVQAPYTEGGIEKAAIQLIGIGKTEILEPGESETVTVEFDPMYMASYDKSAVKADGTEGAWVLEAGDYYFAVGNGVHEALNNVLANKQGSADGLVTITDDETINADNAIVWNLDTADIETYSVNVKNTLQDSDINTFIDGAAEYATRSDWSKGWNPVTDITATDEMLVGLTNTTYAVTENGAEVTWGADNDLNLIDFMTFDADGNFTGALPLDDPQWDLLMDQMTLEEAINFIEAAGDDFENIDSIGLQRTNANDGPVGFAYDQRPGYATGWSDSQSAEPTYVGADDAYSMYSMAVFPTEPVVASTFNKELAKEEGELMGEDALWANISTILAPGLNLHRTPYCARNHECYSEDAMLTNILGLAICEGGNSKGLMMEPKHFAFNHQELNRTGISTFFDEQAARENELRAFQSALSSNQARGLMTAYNRVGTVYSGADVDLQVNILRDEWGYTGWIVTDMVGGPKYQNWKDTVLGGGGGMLANNTTYANCVWGTMASNQEAISKDETFQTMMKQAIKYYAYNIASSNAMNGMTSTMETIYVKTWWQNAILGAEIGLAALTALFAILCFKSIMKKKVVMEEE